MQKTMTFDITIPVLNEEETLEQNVKVLHDFVSQHFPDKNLWNIIIADNGSTDNTAQIALDLGKTFPEVKLVKVPEKGVGLALKTSWNQSTADIVGYMDLDLATDLPHFLDAYEAIATLDYDLVYASRLHKKSEVINRPLKREISSRVFNLLVKLILGTKFSDGQCGFKWLKRSVFPMLQEKGVRDNGWFLSTELVAVGEWQNLKIFELPVKWTDDISSTRVKVIPLAKRFLKKLLELKPYKHAK